LSGEAYRSQNEGAESASIRKRQIRKMQVQNTRRGRSRGKCLSPTPAIVSHFERAKGAKFHQKPLFACFKTKSDVHPGHTKSLGKKYLFTGMRYSRKKTIFGHCAQMVKQKTDERSCVIVLDTPSRVILYGWKCKY